MKTSEYTKHHASIILMPVSKNWLKSVEAYNKMKCSVEFYRLFSQYNFMMTYELDSYIFNNNWEEAHVFKYDYIGAPWFYKENLNEARVGNSGFSIRNIQRCIAVLNTAKRVKNIWNIFSRLQLHRILRLTIFLRVFNPLWNIKGKNVHFFKLFTDDHVNEDIFWCHAVSELFHFELATINDAIKFSFELRPRELYKLNNNQLPIGCHAWLKTDHPFWSTFIKEEEIINTGIVN